MDVDRFYPAACATTLIKVLSILSWEASYWMSKEGVFKNKNKCYYSSWGNWAMEYFWQKDYNKDSL